MRNCLVCFHSYEKGTTCPRCLQKKTTFKPDFKNLKLPDGIKAFHECPELDEMLGLTAFKSGKGWFVNVETWVDGNLQYAVVSVPLERFKELISEVEKVDKQGTR